MENQKQEKNQKTRWHRLLGKMLEELLTPVDIAVMTDFSIMSEPPEADILLLRRNLPNWSEEQKSLLPDGIRDTDAEHILIEFKYTESVNQSVLNQALAYDTFYKRAKKLSQNRVKTFVLSSKRPTKHFFNKFDYKETSLPGIYKSNAPMLESLTVISLNDLTDEPHNLFVKCFASRKKEQDKAFKKLFKSGKNLLRSGLYRLIAGLWKIKNSKEVPMKLEMTPEDVMEIGKEWEELFLNIIPVERKLAGLKPQEVMSAFKPQERLAGLKPQERMAGLSSEELKEIEQYINNLKNKK
ncbi:conserved hypothetical protein [Desulfamplus magnetovallimortis]|uniref:Uncharacterized protein n=1 Tax=Desulfamplus magnetovallimortis TaxID=1246637 RepID=A0A1W1H7I1_9BACT|nr:hypothetical protein [Desulfamplus magnetovallimortis]SLM28394.1 conserved hypothetical protein [Desulfamplus magnetovallimortis]